MKILVGYIDNCKSSGIDHYLIDFAKKYLSDNTSIDFLTRNNSSFVKKTIEDLGCGLHIIPRNRHPIRQLLEMRRIIKAGKYDAAYFNISESYNCIGIIAAKLFGIKKVIVHSHSSGTEKNHFYQRLVARVLNYTFKPILTFNSDLHLSCSDRAAKWLFPNNIFYNNAYVEVKNTVNISSFAFSQEARDRIRKDLKLKDCFTIGTVGRLSYQKNHSFLIKCFSKIAKKVPESRLVLIGDGPDCDRLKKLASKKGVGDIIIFVKPVNNIRDYLSAFDCFVLPSKFEGYPYVGVEAQVNGLPCVFSNNITRSIDISKHSIFASIHRPSEWVKQIISLRSQKRYPAPKCYSDKNDIIDLAKSDSSNCLSFVAFAFKALLGLHYTLNITATFNGFSYLLIPSALLLILFTLMKFPDFFKRKITNFKVFLPLLLFVVSYVITFFITKRYEITESAKILLWALLHFFFVFDCFYLKTISNAKRELYIVGKTIVCIFSIVNLHNLYLLLFGVSKVSRVYNGGLHRFGLSTWGRFYGNFYDANYASVVCVICASLAIYLFIKTRSVFRRILLLISIALNLTYVYMSESRTGLVALAVAIAAATLFSILSNKKRPIIKAAIGVVCISIFVIAAPKASIEAYNHLHKQQATTTAAPASTPQKPTAPTSSQPTIGRTDFESDQSNGRFDIWKDAISISKDNLAVGVGFANLLPYAQENKPDSYMAKRKMSASHNFVLDVLVSQGIVGIVCLLLLLSVIATMLAKNLLRHTISCSTILVLSIVLSIAASAMFVSEIFYINNMPTYLFWLFGGYLALLLAKGVCRENC